jgi:MraZ protein
MKGQLFISTFSGTLDGKGRVCIPASFREILSAQETLGVYLRPVIGEAMLEGFGEQLMAEYHAKLQTLDPFDAADLDDNEHFALSLTQLLPRDENGRVRLPDEFIAHAGLKDRVVFVGQGARFQIWEPEAHTAMLAERKARYEAKRAAAKAARSGP